MRSNTITWFDHPNVCPKSVTLRIFWRESLRAIWRKMSCVWQGGFTDGRACKLPEADRQEALERFWLIQPHLEGGLALTAVARDAGIPY